MTRSQSRSSRSFTAWPSGAVFEGRKSNAHLSDNPLETASSGVAPPQEMIRCNVPFTAFHGNFEDLSVSFYNATPVKFEKLNRGSRRLSGTPGTCSPDFRLCDLHFDR